MDPELPWGAAQTNEASVSINVQICIRPMAVVKVKKVNDQI